MGTVQPEILRRVLHHIDDPVFLIDDQRRLVCHNAVAEQVLRAATSVSVQSGQLLFSPSSLDAQLQQRLEFAGLARPRPATTRNESSRALKLPRKGSAKDWLVLIAAVSEPPDATAGRALFIVHLVGRLHPRHLPMPALRDLFELTRKEADVVTGLLHKQSLRDIALHLALSHETIRSHLKRIFRKCDVQSQAELLMLIHKVALFSSGPASKNVPVWGYPTPGGARAFSAQNPATFDGSGRGSRTTGTTIIRQNQAQVVAGLAVVEK